MGRLKDERGLKSSQSFTVHQGNDHMEINGFQVDVVKLETMKTARQIGYNTLPKSVLPTPGPRVALSVQLEYISSNRECEWIKENSIKMSLGKKGKNS
jgi:hypothetical protein